MSGAPNVRVIAVCGVMYGIWNMFMLGALHRLRTSDKDFNRGAFKDLHRADRELSDRVYKCTEDNKKLSTSLSALDTHLRNIPDLSGRRVENE